MGKAGRFACIFVPMVLSIGVLIASVFTMVAGSNSNNSTLNSMYYFTANTSAFAENATFLSKLENSVFGDLIPDSLDGQASSNKLYDFYNIYLYNYCAGNYTDNVPKVTYCSPRQNQFVFNPVQQWGLNGTIFQRVIPNEINTALNAYTRVAKFMFVVYLIAFWLNVATIIIGLTALCSRVGSCITAIVSVVSSFFTVAYALLATVIYSVVVGAFDGALKEYKVDLTLGTRILALEWIAVALSIVASILWMISSCCCSGRSDRKRNVHAKESYFNDGGNFNNRGPSYQPIHTGHDTHMNQSTTYNGAAGPYKGRESAYEPFRHGA